MSNAELALRIMMMVTGLVIIVLAARLKAVRPDSEITPLVLICVGAIALIMSVANVEGLN